MRQAHALLGLVAGLLVGCAGRGALPGAALVERFRPFQALAGGDIVQMDVALIEQPVGDAYLNQELWELADEQALPLECKALLTENGLRVGQVGGIAPAGLQALLTAERSCPNPRRIQVHAGKSPQPFALGPPRPRCEFIARYENRDQAFLAERAVCKFLIVPSLTPDGRTRLRFTPQVQHSRLSLPQVSAERLLELTDGTVEAFSALAWEVTLAPNEFAVIGGRLDRPNTLGHQFFVRGDEGAPVQRLLVIRTSRGQPGLADDEVGGSVPPLALQAAWTPGPDPLLRAGGSRPVR